MDGIPTDANRSNDIAPAIKPSSVVPRSGLPSRSSRSRAAISLKLDDPSFTAPIFANLFNDPDGESYTLIWSCGRKSTVD